MSEPGKLVYLFLMSIVPTVPAGWLTFAEGVVYDAYDNDVNLWGMNPTDDQQLAGAIMKVVGGFYLWGITLKVDPPITAALLERLGTAVDDHGALDDL